MLLVICRPQSLQLEMVCLHTAPRARLSVSAVITRLRLSHTSQLPDCQTLVQSIRAHTNLLSDPASTHAVAATTRARPSPFR